MQAVIRQHAMNASQAFPMPNCPKISELYWMRSLASPSLLHVTVTNRYDVYIARFPRDFINVAARKQVTRSLWLRIFAQYRH